MHGTDELHIQGFWLKNWKGRDHFKDTAVDGSILLKMILRSGRMWTGFIFPRIGTGVENWVP
jgi:hypothetical protein